MSRSRNSSNYLTIAELRFSPVRNLGEKIHPIQTAFRVANYVDSAAIQSQSLQVERVDEQKLLRPTVQSAYIFVNKNKTSHFILNSECLTFKTSDYQDVDSFLSFFLEGVFIVNKALGLSFAHRIGMRVLERIVPSKGILLQNYLAVSELHLLQKLGGHVVVAQTEVFHQMKEIQLLNRVKVCGHSGLELPRDIDPADMAFKAHLITYAGPSIFIDSDGYVEKKQKFSIAGVKKNLNEIQTVIDQAFKASVAPEALNELSML